jgi:hypothetical protein
MFFKVPPMTTIKIPSRLLMSISVLALAACGGASDRHAPSSKTAAPLPPVSETTHATSVPVSNSLSPLDAVESPSPLALTSGGDPAMESRIARLESAIGSLRTDYDRIMPAFASLNSTNERIQNLLDQIERDTGKVVVETSAPAVSTTTTTSIERVSAQPALGAEKGLKIEETKVVEQVKVSRADDEPQNVTPVAHAVVKATPIDTKVYPNGVAVTTSVSGAVPAESTPDVETARRMAAEQTGGQTVASNVRIGEHPEKTRLVLDLSKNDKPSFKTDLDNNEKILTLDLPGVTWGGATTGGSKVSGIIAGWSANKAENGGSTLAITLKKSAKILSTQYINAEKGVPARLVIDLGPAS